MKIIFTLVLLIIAFLSKAQTDIATARAMPVGSTVTIRGIVTNGAEFGVIRYVQDPTAGIGVYSATFAPLPGDSVEVTGVTSSFNNLMEISPVNSFTILSSGNPLPAPQVVNMLTGFSENFEGELVRFNTSHFISTGTFQTSSANYTATDNSLVSAEVRVNSTTNIAGTPIPVGDLDLVGIMSQYQSSYQLLPRDLNDIIIAGNPPLFTSGLNQVDILQTSFTVTFTTLNTGTTTLEYGTTQSLGQTITDAGMVTNHSLNLSGLSAATLYYVRAYSVGTSGDTSFSAITPMMSASASTGNIICYFTRPVDNSVAQGVNAVSLPQLTDDTLIAYMNRSIYTMDIAIYNMDNDNGIVDAINAAYNRGVVVRVIGDGDNIDAGAWALISIGTNMKKLSPGGINYGIMHHKFVVIDRDYADKAVVWTGSMNFTDQQVNTDANNVIIFWDQSLAKAYTMEFEEMFNDGLFGPDKTNNTPKQFNVGGSNVELFFSPSDDTESQIKRVAISADYDLEVCLFVFTRYNISFDIDDQYAAGVWGGGIVDDTANGGFAFSVLSQEYPSNFFVANHSYIVHNKYMIVDANHPFGYDPVVLTGSHNWSTSAQFDNDENTVIVHDADVANQYFQEWVQRYKDEGGTDLPIYNIGIENPNETILIAELYPNPAGNIATLVFDAGNNAATVTVSDLNGRMVNEQTTAPGEFEVKLNVSDLAKGIYFIKMTSGDYSVSRKLVVQ